jgi:hypothetical protein
MNTLLARTLTLAMLTAMPVLAVVPDADAARSNPGAASNANVPDSAQALADQRSERGDIIGVWISEVTLANCATGVTVNQFRGLESFEPDGALMDTNTTPPTSHSQSFGAWWPVWGQRHFGGEMRLFRFNPDGSFAGMNVVERDIVVSHDGRSYTGGGEGHILDPDGNQIMEVCINETGTRVN